MLRWCLLIIGLVFSLPTAALASWNEARTRHFIIYSEQKPEQLRRYAEQLERYDQAVRKLRGMSDPALSDAGKVKIYVLRNQAAVEAMAGSQGVAGFYITRPSGPLAFVHRDDAENDWDLDGRTVFFHEYLHHLMLQDLDIALPGWIVEGAAELFATAREQKDGSLSFGYAPLHRTYGLFNLNSLTIEEMVGATSEKMTSEEVEQLYGRGWLLTHMLTFGNDRKGQMDRYITGLRRGLPALQAGKEAFGDLKQLDRDLRGYLNKSRLTGVSVSASTITTGNVDLRPLSEAEAAMLPVVMRSQRGVSSKTAPAVLADARRIAARFPADPFVLAALAEAEQDAGNNPQAIAAADKALASNPNHAKALVMKARAMLATASKEAAKADWKAVRTAIGRANRLDPDFAEPLMLFYDSYLSQGLAPTRNAVDGLLYAQALVPQDDGLRLLAARQLLTDGKLPAARKMFAPLAYDPHAGKRRAERVAVLTAIDAGKAEEASKLIDKLDGSDQAAN